MPITPRTVMGPRTDPAYCVRRADGYEVSTAPERIDLDLVHGFLSTAYWSRGVSRGVVHRAIKHSLPFGLYDGDGKQLGFGRVVSDHAVFAYLGDVFIVPASRNQGLGIWLVECVMRHPDLQGLRRWMLATADAHGLYSRFGFGPATAPTHMFIERIAPELCPEACALSCTVPTDDANLD